MLLQARVGKQRGREAQSHEFLHLNHEESQTFYGRSMDQAIKYKSNP